MADFDVNLVNTVKVSGHSKRNSHIFRSYSSTSSVENEDPYFEVPSFNSGYDSSFEIQSYEIYEHAANSQTIEELNDENIIPQTLAGEHTDMHGSDNEELLHQSISSLQEYDVSSDYLARTGVHMQRFTIQSSMIRPQLQPGSHRRPASLPVNMATHELKYPGCDQSMNPVRFADESKELLIEFPSVSEDSKSLHYNNNIITSGKLCRTTDSDYLLRYLEEEIANDPPPPPSSPYNNDYQSMYGHSNYHQNYDKPYSTITTTANNNNNNNINHLIFVAVETSDHSAVLAETSNRESDDRNLQHNPKRPSGAPSDRSIDDILAQSLQIHIIRPKISRSQIPPVYTPKQTILSKRNRFVDNTISIPVEQGMMDEAHGYSSDINPSPVSQPENLDHGMNAHIGNMGSEGNGSAPAGLSQSSDESLRGSSMPANHPTTTTASGSGVLGQSKSSPQPLHSLAQVLFTRSLVGRPVDISEGSGHERSGREKASRLRDTGGDRNNGNPPDAFMSSQGDGRLGMVASSDSKYKNIPLGNVSGETFYENWNGSPSNRRSSWSQLSTNTNMNNNNKEISSHGDGNNVEKAEPVASPPVADLPNCFISFRTFCERFSLGVSKRLTPHGASKSPLYLNELGLKPKSSDVAAGKNNILSEKRFGNDKRKSKEYPSKIPVMTSDSPRSLKDVSVVPTSTFNQSLSSRSKVKTQASNSMVVSSTAFLEDSDGNSHHTDAGGGYMGKMIGTTSAVSTSNITSRKLSNSSIRLLSDSNCPHSEDGNCNCRTCDIRQATKQMEIMHTASNVSKATTASPSEADSMQKGNQGSNGNENATASDNQLSESDTLESPFSQSPASSTVETDVLHTNNWTGDTCEEITITRAGESVSSTRSSPSQSPEHPIISLNSPHPAVSRAIASATVENIETKSDVDTSSERRVHKRVSFMLTGRALSLSSVEISPSKLNSPGLSKSENQTTDTPSQTHSSVSQESMLSLTSSLGIDDVPLQNFRSLIHSPKHDSSPFTRRPNGNINPNPSPISPADSQISEIIQNSPRFFTPVSPLPYPLDVSDSVSGALGSRRSRSSLDSDFQNYQSTYVIPKFSAIEAHPEVSNREYEILKHSRRRSTSSASSRIPGIKRSPTEFIYNTRLDGLDVHQSNKRYLRLQSDSSVEPLKKPTPLRIRNIHGGKEVVTQPGVKLDSGGLELNLERSLSVNVQRTRQKSPSPLMMSNVPKSRIPRYSPPVKYNKLEIS